MSVKDKETSRGRSKVGDKERTRISMRASKGVIKIVDKKCPFCNHHKAWLNVNKDNLKCSKCGGVFND